MICLLSIVTKQCKHFVGKVQQYNMNTGKSELNYYQGKEINKQDIREELRQYGGGSVDLSIDQQIGIATILLNHPEKRNAISGKMMVDLEDVITKLETWDSVKGVMVRGIGNTFCSGGDLDFAKATANPDSGFKMSIYMTDILNRFQRLPLVTVALIEGAGALGGGAEIAVSCDFRLMASNAMGIGFVHGRMGIVPAWGGGTRLVNLVGKRKALDLLLTGSVVLPEKAKHLGLIDEIVSATNALYEANSWLESRTKFPVEVIRAAKNIVWNSDVLEESRVFAVLWGGRANLISLQKNIKHKQ